MLVAAAGAGALGAWAEGALLLFLFILGHALEHYAMGRANRAIEALAELAPRTALVRRGDGGLREVPVEELVLGDRSAERRVGTECVCTCRSRCAQSHKKKNNNKIQSR